MATGQQEHPPTSGAAPLAATDPVHAENGPPGNATADKVTEAVAEAEHTAGLGRLGRPLDRRSPFFIGMSAAAGVAVTYGLVEIAILSQPGWTPSSAG